MKIFSTIVMAAALAMGAATANAADGIQTIANYTEDFNTSFVTSSTPFSVSRGWTSAKLASYNTTFTYKATGGVGGSGALQISSQTSSAYDNYVITPKVTGTSTLAVKDLGYYTLGYISVFEMNLGADGKWTVGQELVAQTAYPLEKNGDFITINIPEVQGKYIGIKGSNVMIDDFAAQSVELELFKKLTVSNLKMVSSSTPDCDADGNFTVSMTGKITNTGDMDFHVGDEGFNYGIGIYSSSSEPYTMVKTQAFEADLAVGEAVDVAIEATINTADHPGRLRYDLVEGWKGTGVYGAWVEPTPYEPILRIYDSRHYNIKEAGQYQTEFGAFGKITEDLAKTVTIGNVGAAPMVVTLSAPAGFELSATTLEVAPKTEETFTITAKASTAGIFAGNLTVVNGEYQTVDIPVTAIVLDPSKFFEDFSGNASTKNLPQGWIEMGGKTQWAKTDFTSSSSNNFVHNSTYSTLSILATPLLKVEEGEKMVFDAARKASSSSAGMGVNVYYSADRQNWTLVKEVPASEMQYFSNTQSSPTSQKWTPFTVDGIPAGNWYIGFESGYCSIDDVYGFERVAVDHDVVVKTTEIAKTADVNSEYFANVTLYNLNATAEAEDSYTVSVAFNGEEVAEVASPEIAAEGTAKYEFSFTPHVAGTFPLDVTYTWADGYSILVSDTVTVRPESASLAYTVGNANGTNNTPLFLNYKNSVSETLYTAEQLATAGIKAGDKITSLSYKGYNTAGEVTTAVKAFVMNCEDTEFGDADMTADEDMTKVFDAEVTFQKKGASSATELMLSIPFSEPFIYTGGALRVKMQSEADSYKNVYFETDGTISNMCYGQRSDGQKVADMTSYSAWKFPVTTFGVELTPEALTGKVVDQDGNALEGVSIVLTAQVEAPANGMMMAPVVQYTATTDENGQFTLPIIQTDKVYTAVFSKEGFESYETEFTAPFGAIDDVILKSTSTGINDLKVNASKAIKVIENGEVIIIKDGVRYNVMGQKK